MTDCIVKQRRGGSYSRYRGVFVTTTQRKFSESRNENFVIEPTLTGSQSNQHISGRVMAVDVDRYCVEIWRPHRCVFSLDY